MVERLHYVLVSPERKLSDEYVLRVNIPGLEGRLEVLPHHAPCLILLKPGLLMVDTVSEKRTYFISGGYADISEAGVIILAESAVPATELTRGHLNACVLSEKESLEHATDFDVRDVILHRLAALEQLSQDLPA